MKQTAAGKRDPMRLVATFIVERRALFYIVFLAALIFCALSVGRVQINSDITAFLPAETETRRGLSIMESEFKAYGSARVMVSNISYDRAEQLAEEIERIDGVVEAGFDGSAAHYRNSAALFSVSFDGEDSDPRVLAAMEEIRTLLGSYDTYISSTVGQDIAAQLAEEMTGILLLALLVIAAVLLFTSRSYFEVVIFFIVFGVAALLNMGTNYLLGEISSITNSVAVILQLALAIDYAIIFSHRYQDECGRGLPEKEALIEALSKAIVEISSSSLTTVSGLVALTLMQFRLGYDLGIVLCKGIVCSLLTVFLLMPGLIMLFPRQLARTVHKSYVPDIGGWGNFLARHKYLFSGVFILLIPAAVYCSAQCEYAFSESTVDQIVPSEQRIVSDKIESVFGPENMVAVLVPRGDYASEKALLRDGEALSAVSGAVGLANTEIETGRVLTDGYTPRMFAELLDIDIEEATLVYQLYGLAHEDYKPIFGDSSAYAVPLVDLFLFVFEKADQGLITLDEQTEETMDTLRETLDRALVQLRGETWCRLLFTTPLPDEGEESVALVEDLRTIAGQYYGEENVLVIGNITSARDLSDSFSGDNRKISVLTLLFVFVILLFTFQSVAGAALLVFVIQGSIWINFSFPYLTDTNLFFVTYLIVSAIQMGATIDYAIVIMNRYQALRAEMEPRQAVAGAIRESFATVLTSGSIMTAAGFLIAFMTTDAYVGSIGLALGRGTLLSVILVLTVLPQLIYLLDRPIRATRFDLKRILGGEEK